MEFVPFLPFSASKNPSVHTVYLDLYLNDMIWVSVISSATVLEKRQDHMVNMNHSLFHNLKQTLKDRELKEVSTLWFKNIIQFLAANDVELWDYVGDLYQVVREDLCTDGLVS